MLLRNMLATDGSAGGVFFPVDTDGDGEGLAETVVLYPAGVYEDAVEVVAQVNRGILTGTQQVHGDGYVKESDRGRTVRKTISISFPAGTAIDDARRAKNGMVDLVRIFTPGSLESEIKSYRGGDDSVGQVFALKTITQNDSVAVSGHFVQVHEVIRRRGGGREG